MLAIIRQIQRFTQERMKDFLEFLEKYPDAEILVGDHYSIQRDTTYVLSAGSKKIMAVPRPRERPYQMPVIYGIHKKEGGVQVAEDAVTKIRTFLFSSRAEEMNAFLSTHHVSRIILIPFLEMTCPLDNYCPGEYGPVPDRQPAYARTHQLMIVYKE